MYNCFDIAKYFVELSKEDGKGIDPMKLLKITYIAQGFYLAFFDKPLFSNQIQAWKYGPVIPELYHVIKPFRNSYVDPFVLELHSKKNITDVDKKFLKALWNSYKDVSGIQLSELTHKENTPWQKSFKPNQSNITIDNSIIKTYYKQKVSA